MVKVLIKCEICIHFWISLEIVYERNDIILVFIINYFSIHLGVFVKFVFLFFIFKFNKANLDFRFIWKMGCMSSNALGYFTKKILWLKSCLIIESIQVLKYQFKFQNAIWSNWNINFLIIMFWMFYYYYYYLSSSNARTNNDDDDKNKYLL